MIGFPLKIRVLAVALSLGSLPTFAAPTSLEGKWDCTNPPTRTGHKIEVKGASIRSNYWDTKNGNSYGEDNGTLSLASRGRIIATFSGRFKNSGGEVYRFNKQGVLRVSANGMTRVCSRE